MPSEDASHNARETEVLAALVEALAPLMDRDYCSPFTSAWELDPWGGPQNWDGEVIYKQVRAAWEQGRTVLADRV